MLPQLRHNTTTAAFESSVFGQNAVETSRFSVSPTKFFNPSIYMKGTHLRCGPLPVRIPVANEGLLESPQNGWLFIMEHPMKKWMIWGYHYFWKHPYRKCFFHQTSLCGGNSNIFGIFTPKIGEDEPILTSIFFRWGGSTTN